MMAQKTNPKLKSLYKLLTEPNRKGICDIICTHMIEEFVEETESIAFQWVGKL